MDPSSNIVNSSEFSVEIQPRQPAPTNITHMDVALYKAAARGKFEKFKNFQGFELKSLQTRNHDTVLHVYLATKDPFDVLRSDKKILKTMFHVIETIDSWLRYYLGMQERNWKFQTSFIEQILIKCPSLLLEPNVKGQTPLHIAARYGHSDIVKFLITYRAKALHRYLEGMELERVREMLRKTDKESNTALHVAAQYGQFLVVQELVEFEDPDFLYSVNRNQETPLYIAARRGDSSSLSIMLDKFKSADHGGPNGRTVLHAAAMARNAKATRKILEKKENLSLTKETDENGQTPLHYAAHLGRYSVVKVLLHWDNSAAYVADKKWEMTALLMAARQGNSRTVKAIISCCPDCCEMVDKRGWNLLHYAAFRNEPKELIRFLRGDSETTASASIRDLRNEKDALGITPEQVYKSIRDLIHLKDALRITPEQVYASIRDLRNVKDAVRITPKQVAAYMFYRTLEAASHENNQSTRKMEEITELLENIVNEEVAEAPVRPIGKLVSNRLEKAKEAHLVVAGLIATVTFTAAIAVPGGYNSEKGPDQGTPFLIRNTAFTAFVISDSLAFIFSLCAVAIHFKISHPFHSKKEFFPFELANRYIVLAVWALVIAFSTGTYAVLQPSPSLAIASCCIGLSYFILRLFVYTF